MPDNPASPEAENEDTGPSLFDQPDGVDWFLANQIYMADAYKIEQGITLNVGGVLVSGILIGGRAYFDGLSKYLKEKTEGTSSEEFGRLLADSHVMFTELYPERQEDETYPIRPAGYIHLKSARVIGSNGYMSSAEGGYWRGKLAAVDGYFFGNMTVGT